MTTKHNITFDKAGQVFCLPVGSNNSISITPDSVSSFVFEILTEHKKAGFTIPDDASSELLGLIQSVSESGRKLKAIRDAEINGLVMCEQSRRFME